MTALPASRSGATTTGTTRRAHVVPAGGGDRSVEVLRGGSGALRIERADPGEPGPLALLTAHLALMRAISPPESVHALDLVALRGPDIVFLALREGGETIGIGALKRPVGGDPAHGEIKSMHTAVAHRGRGIGRTMLGALLAEARAAGAKRLSLETGSTAHFAPARALYAAHGFGDCGPIAGYGPDPHSHFMTRAI